MDLTKMGMIQLQASFTGSCAKANQMLAGRCAMWSSWWTTRSSTPTRTVLACTSKMFEILFPPRNSQHYALDFLSPKTFIRFWSMHTRPRCKPRRRTWMTCYTLPRSWNRVPGGAVPEVLLGRPSGLR